MILIDANIIMYAAGAPHAHKEPSVRLLEDIARGDVDAVLDAETLQEILHRYRAIKRWKDGRKVYDLAREIFPDVIPITHDILDRARGLLDHHPALMARDALHAAVVLHERLEALCSYDRDFDRVVSITRIEPGSPSRGPR